MAAKNSLKIYLPNSYYHLYNRGVEKREIFCDKQDYSVFILYLKEYLTPKPIDGLMEKLNSDNISGRDKDKILKLIQRNNFFNEIWLLCYCLMPNHFHFEIKQSSANSIDKFMNSFCLRYSMYFNKKYKRVGKLFQGVYKASLVENEEQLLYLSKYIHLNPVKEKINGLKQIILQPSSYLNFTGEIKQDWLVPNDILLFYSQKNDQRSYKSFIESEFKEVMSLGSKTMIDNEDN